MDTTLVFRKRQIKSGSSCTIIVPRKGDGGMEIPDCYDPVRQAEQLEAEADKHAVHCYCCGDAISGDAYIVDGENICEDCLPDVIKSNYTAKEIAKAFAIPVRRPCEI